MTYEWRQGAYLISTDKTRLDFATIHSFLTTAYWSEGVPLAVVKQAIENSLAFGLYEDGRQLGFARLVTDYATFAYLADVFVLESERGKGLGTWLVETVVSHPELQGLRRWLLFTKDAHLLYQKVGFTLLAQPERAMERRFPNRYADGQE